MKPTLIILTFLIIVTSCDFRPKSFELEINEIREDFAEESEINNSNTLAWENLIDSFYKIADTNQIATFSAIDNLINNDKTLDRHNISELHFIKGDIYYRIDSLKKALIEFTTIGQKYSMETPKYQAARAGVFLKLRQYENALVDLNKAAEINHYYLWNIGNYYEAIGNKDSAIYSYNRLYLYDTTYYNFCKARITELRNPKTKLFSELVYRDRERLVILMKGVK